MLLLHQLNMSCLIYVLPLVLSVIPMVFFIAEAQGQAHAIFSGQKSRNSSVPAIFVFGDSTVDPGNNDYIPTVGKANFPPYGRDFPDGVATGRFTNGRLATDFISSYLGIKDLIPPYLDQRLSLHELVTGVSFASGGSGLDRLTAGISFHAWREKMVHAMSVVFQKQAIDMPRQMDLFRHYRRKLEHRIGKIASDNLINNAAYVVSAGTNDFVVNYFAIPVRRQKYSVTGFQNFVLQQLRQFIQDLVNQGARRIAIAGLPPIGCLPLVITLNSRGPRLQRDCLEPFNSVARAYNEMLQNELNATRGYLSSRGVKIAYIDIYTPIIKIIRNPKAYGIDEINSGCCGIGFLEAGFLCNAKSLLCPDRSKYVFFDSIHPTEKAYYTVFRSILPIIDSIAKD